MFEVMELEEPSPHPLDFLTQLKGESVARLYVLPGIPRSSKKLVGRMKRDGWNHFNPRMPQRYWAARPWP